MGIFFSNLFSRIVVLVVLGASFGGCKRTLVFGESSGFNLAVKSDAAKATPLEINAGLRREVMGIVPARQPPVNGTARGEATNLFSRFQVAQTPDPNSPFGGTLVISTAFASGQAALNIVNGKTDLQPVGVVESIVRPVDLRPVEFRLTDDPDDRTAIGALQTFVVASPTNLETYMALARARNLNISVGSTPTTNALGTINNPANAAQNREIARELSLTR